MISRLVQVCGEPVTAQSRRAVFRGLRSLPVDRRQVRNIWTWRRSAAQGRHSPLLSVCLVMWLISSSKETSQQVDLLEQQQHPAGASAGSIFTNLYCLSGTGFQTRISSSCSFNEELEQDETLYIWYTHTLTCTYTASDLCFVAADLHVRHSWMTVWCVCACSSVVVGTNHTFRPFESSKMFLVSEDILSLLQRPSPFEV